GLLTTTRRFFGVGRAPESGPRPGTPQSMYGRRYSMRQLKGKLGFLSPPPPGGPAMTQTQAVPAPQEPNPPLQEVTPLPEPIQRPQPTNEREERERRERAERARREREERERRE